MTMKLSFYVIVLLLGILIDLPCLYSQTIVTRSHSWKSYDEFAKFGWTPSKAGWVKLSLPSELDVRLDNLNNGAQDVWGYKQGSTRSNIYWTFPTDTKFCGITNATVTIKYYMEKQYSTASSYFFPCTGSGSGNRYCYLQNSPTLRWSTVTKDITDYTYWRFLFDLNPTGLILIDEVNVTYTLSYTHITCPHSCNRDCQHVGLDCHNFYSCINRQYRSYDKCPLQDGLAFNPETSSCDLIANVPQCLPKEPPPDDCVCEYRLHPTSCSKYLYCEDSCHPEDCMEKSCPGGLVWSMDANGDGKGLQRCIHPTNTTCSGYDDPKTTQLPTDAPNQN